MGFALLIIVIMLLIFIVGIVLIIFANRIMRGIANISWRGLRKTQINIYYKECELPPTAPSWQIIAGTWIVRITGILLIGTFVLMLYMLIFAMTGE